MEYLLVAGDGLATQSARSSPNHPLSELADDLVVDRVDRDGLHLNQDIASCSDRPRAQRLSERNPYATSSIVSVRPLNCTVSPARAPSIASKIGAIVEMPMSSRP
jgi:hypothetical protein